MTKHIKSFDINELKKEIPCISENGLTALESRYLDRDEHGFKESPVDLFKRVAKTVASACDNEAKREKYEQEFYDLMVSGRFMPNSPTLMNAGRKLGMLSACFVLPLEDSLESILNTQRAVGLIQAAGGGTGFTLDKLRPCGDFIKSSGGTTSGPIAFWRMFSSTTDAIQQGCVSGDTLVATVSGPKKIAELVDTNPWVFCFNTDTQEYVVKRANKVWKTGEDKQVYELVTDKGLKVKATGDHLFLCRDNVYRRLDSLKTGMSLMPFYRQGRKYGGTNELRDLFVTTKYGTRKRQHIFVHEQTIGEIPKGMTVHHIDGNHFNDEPTNLQLMSRDDHLRYHNSKRIEEGVHTFQTRKFEHSGELNGMHRDGRFWKDPNKVAAYKKRMSEIKSTCPNPMRDPEYVKRCIENGKESRQKQRRRNLLKVLAQVINVHGECTAETYNKNAYKVSAYYRKYYSLDRFVKEFGSFENALTELGKTNHKVVSITPCGTCDVFDMEVPDVHNYIVCTDNSLCSNGIIIHNSFRRGANLANLHPDHPDIFKFLFAKQNLAQFNNFNISVKIDDETINSIKTTPNEPLTVTNERSGISYYVPRAVIDKCKQAIELSINEPTQRMAIDTCYDLNDLVAVSAGDPPADCVTYKDLWDIIVTNAHATGEPGLCFDDRINEANKTPHTGPINATNPCVTGETLVAVADGRVAVPIKQLADEGNDVPVYCNDSDGKLCIKMMRNPRVTGRGVPIYRVLIEGGHEVRVTANHKFVLSDGKIKQTTELLAGDGLMIMNRWSAPIEYVIANSNSKSQDYYWMNNTNYKTWRADHRYISGFHSNRDLISSGVGVVHHKDRNGKNNDPANLEIMTKEDHDKLHSDGMLGDKNPMRRAKSEWGADKWDNYRRKMSKSTAGTRNGRYCGITNEQLFAYAVDLTRKTGHKITTTEWNKHARSAGLPTKFTAFRKTALGTISEFLERAAFEAGLTVTGLKHAAMREYKRFLKILDTTDLDVFFDGNVIKVNKVCEQCGKPFVMPWTRREQCLCSHHCASLMLAKNSTVKGKRAASNSGRRAAKRTVLINAYNTFKAELGRTPLKSEFANYCATNGIPFRLASKNEVRSGKLHAIFNNWSDLKEQAQVHNHKIVAVIPAGNADVYNGTVDQYHNFYIGHFAETLRGKPNFIYINNLQCGEAPLQNWEACNLASLNLSAYVKDLYVLNADDPDYEPSVDYVDWDTLRQDTATAVRFLDYVISVNKYPLPEIDTKVKRNRKIGLGVMGFADALFKLGIPYDSKMGIKWGKKFMRVINTAAINASKALAEELGEFPDWKGSVWEKDGIKLRNAEVTICAPTGTISMIANCSCGIEPIFSVTYLRQVLGHHKLFQTNEVFEAVAKAKGFWTETLCEEIAKTGSIQHIPSIPDVYKQIFVSANEVNYKWHVQMQAAFQEYVTNAISKTINMRHDAKVEDVANAYLLAHELGCKGITVYRDGCRKGQPMTAIKAEKEKEKDKSLTPAKAPEIGVAFKMKRETVFGSLHINIVIDLNSGKELEVFAQLGKSGEHTGASLEGLCRLISMWLRSGGDIKYVIEQLMGIGSTIPTATRKATSLPNELAMALVKYAEYKDKFGITGLFDPKNFSEITENKPVKTTTKKKSTELESVLKMMNEANASLYGQGVRAKCPNCAGMVIYQSGCSVCLGCGYSSCS